MRRFPRRVVPHLGEVQLGRQVTRYLHASLRFLNVGLEPFVHGRLQFWLQFHGQIRARLAAPSV